MTQTGNRRTGIVKYLGNVLDETKDLVDDMLDRARDVEHDLRDTARRAVDTDDDTGRDDELAELRQAVANLATKVEELAALQTQQHQEQSNR